MKKGVTRTLIDDAGIFGTHVSVDPNIAAIDETVKLLQALTPLARINALRDTPELDSKIRDLLDLHDHVFRHGTKISVTTNANGRRSVKFSQVDENENLKLLNAIASAEYARVRIKAVPLISKVKNQCRTNSNNAKNPRKTLTDGDGNKFSIVEIAKNLLLKHPNETAKGLWSHLYSILDEMGLDPVEEFTITKREGKELVIVFSQGVEQASIKLGTWRTTISKERKKKT